MPARPQSTSVSPIVEGAMAYREMRWDDAIRVLSRAIDEENITGSDLGKAHILLGAIKYQQGDSEAARSHFVEAHRRDPQTQPSPELFPPHMIDFYRTVNSP
jgi:tetratricopeptide (TPR) repeat protein